MNSYKALQIKLAKKISGDFLGSFMSVLRWSGMEFESLREYFPGDSVKKIDWKTTAKNNKVFIKNFNEQRDINALFIFDLSKSLLFGSRDKTKLDTTKEAFYMLATAANSNWLRIGSQLGKTYFDFSAGNKNIIQTLDYLDTINLSRFSKSTYVHWNTKKLKNTLIFILSDQTNPQDLHILARHNDIIYINIFDSLESQWSNSSFLLPISWMLSFFSKRKQSAYQNAHLQTLQHFKKQLIQKQIRHINLDDQDNLILSFYKFFTKTI